MGELKDKAVKGVFWSAVDKGGVKAISFIVSIIIARILSPDDYGTIGMILVFINISNIIIDSGISQALVQRKDRSDTDMSTAFFFNIAIGVLCYFLLFILAPAISRFYNVAELTPILRVLGIVLIFNSLATVQRANLLIKLDFKTMAAVNLVGVIVSAGVGLCSAYSGFGVWALVFQQLTLSVTVTGVFWLLGKWRPFMCFSTQSFRHLWHFGNKLLIAGLVATILREIYSMTIGKFYHKAELGFYSRAVQTTDMVAYTTYDVINAVSFPILSTLQDDRTRLISIYSRMLAMTAFIIFPIMTMLAVLAEPLVSVLLTDKWLPAVVLIQWLCFARVFTPISALNMNILNAVGRSDLFMKLDFSKTPLIIIAMIITIPIGVKAIIIGDFIISFICYFINAYLPGRMFGFGIKAQWVIFYRIVIATAIMALCGSLVVHFVTNKLLALIIGSFMCLTIYILCAKTLKITQLQELSEIALTKLKAFKI